MLSSLQSVCLEDSAGNRGGNCVGVHGQFNAKLSKRAQVFFRHKTENPQRLAKERWDCFFSQSSEWEQWEIHRETGYLWKSIFTSVGTSVGNQASGKQIWRAWLSLPCSSGEPATMLYVCMGLRLGIIFLQPLPCSHYPANNYPSFFLKADCQWCPLLNKILRENSPTFRGFARPIFLLWERYFSWWSSDELRVNVWVRMSWEQVVEEKGVHNVTYLLTPVTGFPLQQAEKPFAAANYRGRNSFLLQGDKGEDLQLLTNCSVCINFPLIPMKQNGWLIFFLSVLIFCSVLKNQ